METYEDISDCKLQYILLNSDFLKTKFTHDKNLFLYNPPTHEDNDVVFASSRGGGLQELSGITCYSTPGARLSTLVAQAEEYIRSHKNPTGLHVYFVAGLCDITTKLHHPTLSPPNSMRKSRYQEVIMGETIRHKTDQLKRIYDQAITRMTPYGARPIFCTIPPCNLLDWNLSRLDKRKTAYLQHVNRYEEMQTNLEEVIIEINRYIWKLNSEVLGSFTPDLTSSMSKKEGGKKRRFFYKRLSDGVHPSQELRSAWAVKLQEAINSNRR